PHHPGRGRRRAHRAARTPPRTVPAGPAGAPRRHAVTEPIDLAYLIHHYGEAYKINIRRGRYEARRRDDGTMLTADSPDALLHLIRADYADRPVSRRTAGADTGCRTVRCRKLAATGGIRKAESANQGRKHETTADRRAATFDPDGGRAGRCGGAGGGACLAR